MTIGNIVKPWSFVNNTETADATKVNTNFDVAISAINDCINALNAAEGSRTSLTARLTISLNDDGTIKSSALPVGSYDPRRTRTVTESGSVLSDDATIFVDTTAGDINLTLLDSTMGVKITIVNIGLTGHNAVILPLGSDLIMGLDNYALSVGGESITLAPATALWWRVA